MVNLMFLNCFNFGDFLRNFFVTQSIGELLLSLILVYNFRFFERLMGSNKYAVFCTLSCVFSCFVQFVYLMFFNRSATVVFCGPYPIIFACFALYFTQVPVLYSFTRYNLPFNDKSIYYFLGFELLLSYFPYSLISSLCGFLFGLLYQDEQFYLSSIKFPSPIIDLCRKFIKPYMGIIESPVQINYANDVNQNNLPPHDNNLIQQRNAISEDNILALVNMGFTREEAIDALRINENVLDHAITYLIGNHNNM